ncbi:RNA polymerase-binding protein RbpA [Corynebacterium sp. HS2168-gen11]|uniref:RNA polymerase-binding protein RbpA n=1 Tax=Corynebacterium sp. HS2168-gen11 TaxID=2974027 RepID=UPI00216B2668|nr:RNA polymerase-binding protein RbpA [Corynebacterium sp. HS2168-gen11]MCS4535064.1 RNA polymerase-binding protein RbpA [Corynebacterium sp. HS2168-gen11]
MADRVLRGSRMGAVSYETDRDHDLAPRQMVRYKTETGEIFDVPFAEDAEIPGTWLCKNGQIGHLMEGSGVEAKPAKPPRTHWDMLRERRSLEELDELLEERIEHLRRRRRNAARLLKQQQEEAAQAAAALAEEE